MERILSLCLIISFSLPALAQETSSFQVRNAKMHRFQPFRTAKKVVAPTLQNSLPLDTVSTTELFPSLDPYECYQKLRREYDVTLRQSAHSWRYKNHKHRKSAVAYMKFRLVPHANRLSYPRTKKRQSIF